MAVLILRVQHNGGVKRIEVSPKDTTRDLYEKICSTFCAAAGSITLYNDKAHQSELVSSPTKTIRSSKLSHGDIIYLDQQKTQDGAVLDQQPQNHTVTRPKVIEDEIDVILAKDDGLIQRKKDPQLCRHGDQGKCLHCSPLEPYDETYLKTLNPPVKHISFHAHVKKLKRGVNKGKFVFLENISCRIKPGCQDHAPWPKGICTKCQPSAITLSRQLYRHVDNIMFENPSIADRFLNYWRTTGSQRVGFMYGRYEKHDSVPLGIRAVVSAIYEPPQESARDSVELYPDPLESIADQVADGLGLVKIGWILTDLLADDSQRGTVQHLRHVDTHFLSAQECITAAHFQTHHPNKCRLSPNGLFGSKFATVVVSGNNENQIHFDGWQVSNQCMALVRDQCLVPTTDEPGLGYIKESSSEQYVPDVFYKEKDDYGNEVTKIGRPMPIEYFLIEVPTGFPLQPMATFVGNEKSPFPIENRTQLGEIQEFSAMNRYIDSQERPELMSLFLDFHFLFFLASSDMLPVKTCMSELLSILKEKDADRFYSWSKSEVWATVEQLMAAHGPSPTHGGLFSGVADAATPPSSQSLGSASDPMDVDATDASGQWTCSHCTFINSSAGASCDICGLPRS